MRTPHPTTRASPWPNPRARRGSCSGCRPWAPCSASPWGSTRSRCCSVPRAVWHVLVGGAVLLLGARRWTAALVRRAQPRPASRTARRTHRDRARGKRLDRSARRLVADAGVAPGRRRTPFWSSRAPPGCRRSERSAPRPRMSVSPRGPAIASGAAALGSRLLRLGVCTLPAFLLLDRADAAGVLSDARRSSRARRRARQVPEHPSIGAEMTLEPLYRPCTATCSATRPVRRPRIRRGDDGGRRVSRTTHRHHAQRQDTRSSPISSSARQTLA